MSFRANDSSVNQTSILDATELMSEREKRFLKRSWAKVFAEEIFPQIDESPFAPMYSDKDSRPNTPVNVTVGALMLKELNGMSDDDILSSLLFDIRFRYALHTTLSLAMSFTKNYFPSWKTLGFFGRPRRFGSFFFET